MNRAEKAAFVENLGKAFREHPHVIVTRFSKLTVNESRELRRKVKEAGGRYSVIKNRLAKRAAAETPVEGLAENFTGPVAVAVHPSDPVSLAKALSDFAKDHPQVELVAGLVDARETIDEAGVKQLASLPGLDELRAKMLALFNTPATQLVRLLNPPGGQIARAIDARREKLES